MTSVVASALALSSVPGAVVDWLLDAAFPTVRRLTLVRGLGRSTDDPEGLDLEERGRAAPRLGGPPRRRPVGRDDVARPVAGGRRGAAPRASVQEVGRGALAARHPG